MTREKVVERLVAWIWERQALVGLLPGDDGAAYQVVFRGRPWGERGPDFQGAIVARQNGELLRGDVEVHVRASDWRRHRHGRDPAYNRMICHVVLWDDQARPTRRQDGVAVPTLELITRLEDPLAELEHRCRAEEGTRPPRSSCLPEEPVGAARASPARRSPTRASPAHPSPARPSDRRPPPTPASPSPASPAPLSHLGDLRERSGVERFLGKSAQLEGDLACLPPVEVLYRGALRAMGYTANTAGFERLAAALPFDALRFAAGADRAAQPLRVQAALLGAAGLLPSQRVIAVEADWPRDLEWAWADLNGAVAADPLPPTAWRWWRVRPENVPTRRAAGLSQVAAAWLRHDPIDLLLDDLAEAERLERPARLAEPWHQRALKPNSSTDARYGSTCPTWRKSAGPRWRADLRLHARERLPGLE